MDVIQSLKGLTAYPIPNNTLEVILMSVGLGTSDSFTSETEKTEAYQRAKAKVYLFLSEAPNVSQGGVSFSFSHVEKEMFNSRAQVIFTRLGDNEGQSSVTYGYLGSDL